MNYPIPKEVQTDMAVQGNRKSKRTVWTKPELELIRDNTDKTTSWFLERLDRTESAINAQIGMFKKEPDRMEDMEFDDNGARVRVYNRANFSKKVKPIRYKSKIKELLLEVGKEYTLKRRLGHGMGKVTEDTQLEIKGKVVAKYDTFYTIDTGNYTTTVPRWGNDFRIE